MPRVAFRIALLIFQAIWLNIVLPGHTRGVITLPGATCESCQQASLPCCAAEHPNEPHRAPPKQAPANCAICFFAAQLSLPPVNCYAPARLGLVEILDPPAPVSTISIRVPLVLHDRGPPAFA